jgi:hypothetical protein
MSVTSIVYNIHVAVLFISSVDYAEGDASLYIKIHMLLTVLVTHTVMKVTSM